MREIKELILRKKRENQEYREYEMKYREVGMDSSIGTAFSDGHYAGFQKALEQILGFIHEQELENQKL